MFSTCVIKDKLDELRFVHYDFFYGEICPKLGEKAPDFNRYFNYFLLNQDVREICKIV
jgi:hypothetical protein